jgi:uncharacterized protein (UPF0261 family)
MHLNVSSKSGVTLEACSESAVLEGTAIITRAMRALPIGLPKLMVSTMASGNVASYVGSCDITMMYSVTDLAGLNRISRRVLANAANALAGMILHALLQEDHERPALGLTMFGVTTACVQQIRCAAMWKKVKGKWRSNTRPLTLLI